MKVAIGIGSWATGSRSEWEQTAQFAIGADRLGVDMCWSAEAWGQDSVAPLGFLAARTERIRLQAAIMQISARVPSMTAMTAMTLATLSDDRFVLGLGVSGPQVVEGLHGVSFADPVGRLTEYLDVIELAFRGEPLRYEGTHYLLPRPGGEAKALRLAQRAVRPIPIYLATLAPRGLELTGSRADGWIGTCFVPEAASTFLEPIRRGAAKAGRDFNALDLQAGGLVRFGDPERMLPEIKQAIAFRIGAMGSRRHNFYNRAFQRAGFEEEAQKIQSLWLDGEHEQAVAAVTDRMAVLTSFFGTDETIGVGIQAFARAGITTIRLDVAGETGDARLAVVERFLDCMRTSHQNLKENGSFFMDHS